MPLSHDIAATYGMSYVRHFDCRFTALLRHFYGKLRQSFNLCRLTEMVCKELLVSQDLGISWRCSAC